MNQRLEETFDRVFFIQVDYYEELLFRVVFDFADQKYKVDIELPPGLHGICFIEATITLDGDKTKALELKKIEWKNELIRPSTKDFSAEARAQEGTPTKLSTGGAFFTSSTT